MARNSFLGIFPVVGQVIVPKDDHFSRERGVLLRKRMLRSVLRTLRWYITASAQSRIRSAASRGEQSASRVIVTVIEFLCMPSAHPQERVGSLRHIGENIDLFQNRLGIEASLNSASPTKITSA